MIKAELVSGVPHPILRDHVLAYSGFAVPHGRRRLEVPTAAVTVMLGFGEPVRLKDAVNSYDNGKFVSLVCGPRTRANLGEHSGGVKGAR